MVTCDVDVVEVDLRRSKEFFLKFKIFENTLIVLRILNTGI